MTADEPAQSTAADCTPEQWAAFLSWRRDNRQEIQQIEQSNAQTVERTILGIGAAVLGAVTLFPEHAAEVAPTGATRVLAVLVLAGAAGAALSILASFVASRMGLDERLDLLERSTPTYEAKPTRAQDYWVAWQRRLYYLAIACFMLSIASACGLVLSHLTAGGTTRTLQDANAPRLIEHQTRWCPTGPRDRHVQHPQRHRKEHR